MQFPILVPIGPWLVHPHWFFEALVYTLAFRVYLHLRRRGDLVPDGVRWSVVAAAALGGAIGSRVLYLLEAPWLTAAQWRDVAFVLGGKSIVGGLVGGLLAVEWIKSRLGVSVRTGDLFAVPLALGIAIGRIGCFLTGLSDHTFGRPSSLAWAVDFGDGVTRHPTQLYEIGFLIALAILLSRAARTPHVNGDIFKKFMAGYFGFRFVVDTLKPDPPLVLGLSTIQWTCLVMLAYYGSDIARWVGRRWVEPARAPDLTVGPTASHDR